MNPEDIQRALDALAPFDSPNLLTADELVALKVLREAFEDMLRGGDISPEIEGVLPRKLRLWKRINLAYFNPASPRPVIAQHPPPAEPPAE